MIGRALENFSIERRSIRSQRLLQRYSLDWDLIPSKDAVAHYNLGVALGLNDMDEESIASFERALEIDPNYFPAQYNHGNTMIRLGRFEEGIDSLNKAILIEGEYAPAHFMLGVAYYGGGRYEDAVAATRQGLEIDPDDFCDDAIARFPYLTRPHVIKGMCFRELGELDNEIQSYRSAVDIKVEDEGSFVINFTALFFLGAAWERKITGSDEGIEYVEADNHFDLQDPQHQFWAIWPKVTTKMLRTRSKASVKPRPTSLDALSSPSRTRIADSEIRNRYWWTVSEKANRSCYTKQMFSQVILTQMSQHKPNPTDRECPVNLSD